MISAFLIYFFFLGIIVGSFLNVVTLRYKTGKTLRGRSACMSCKTQLTWRELVPVFSFLFQRGRCKTCRTKLHIQYPLVELCTGILFASNFLLWVNYASSMFELISGFVLTTFILMLYVVIFVYDLRHKIIPDLFSFTAWGVSIIYVIVSQIQFGILSGYYETPKSRNEFGNQGEMLFIAEHLLAGLVFYLIVWTIWRISRGRLIGLGDAKLLLSIGTILGFVYGLSAIFISVWIATIYACFLLLKQYLSKQGKHITMKTEIPFGPFLILGFLIVYFTHIDVTNISIILENFS